MKYAMYNTKRAFWDAVASQVMSMSKEGVRMALSGGSAAEIIPALKNLGYDFGHVELWQVDERYVPADHAESNQGKLKELLGDDAEMLNVFDVQKNIPDVLDTYEKTLESDDAGNILDIMVLGVGIDGHIASLFPPSTGETMETSTGGYVAHSITNAHAVSDRLTLSWNAIQKTKHVLVLLQGVSKKALWKQVVQKTYEDTPFGLLIREKDNVMVLFTPE